MKKDFFGLSRRRPLVQVPSTPPLLTSGTPLILVAQAYL